MVGEHAARAFAAELDTEGLPACPLCLWELAWAIFRRDAVRRTLVARTAEWLWPDIDDALRAAVVNARMREVAGAEHALRELDEKPCDARSPCVSLSAASNRRVRGRGAHAHASEFRVPRLASHSVACPVTSAMRSKCRS